MPGRHRPRLPLGLLSGDFLPGKTSGDWYRGRVGSCRLGPKARQTLCPPGPWDPAVPIPGVGSVPSRGVSLKTEGAVGAGFLRTERAGSGRKEIKPTVSTQQPGEDCQLMDQHGSQRPASSANCSPFRNLPANTTTSHQQGLLLALKLLPCARDQTHSSCQSRQDRLDVWCECLTVQIELGPRNCVCFIH